MNTSGGRVVTALALTSVIALLGAPSANAQQPRPEQRLAEAFAPLVVVRTQSSECGDGEPYLPMAVDPLLGLEGVLLRGPAGEVVDAPTAEDLAAKGPDWYLDIPGNALQPDCSYERLYRSLDASPAVYARVIEDSGDEDRLVVQYWLFYLYNDWNDRHEGDWEMVQLVFDAADVEAALADEPTLVAYAQHEGAEVADWAEDPLQVDGSRVRVFVGEGSHASYFASEHWFGKSAASGFGCDDTRKPSTIVSPEVLLLTDDAPPPWLSFEGHWGEKQPSFNTGPTGPNTKTQWSEPVRWVEEEGRRGAVALPAGGSPVTNLFCSGVAAGSLLLFRALDNPLLVGGAVLALVILVAGLARRTAWGPVSVQPILARRRGGQIVRTALRIVRRNPILFGTIGLVIPLAGAAASLLQAALVAASELGDLSDVLGRETVFGGLLLTLVGAVFVLPAAAVVAVASVLALRSLDGAEGETTPYAASRFVRRALRAPRALLASLALSVTFAVALASVVLLPLALWWIARSAVAVPSALDGDRPFRRSATLTKGARGRALVLGALAVLIAIVLPALIGVLVLLLTSASFGFVNLIAGVVGLVTVPSAAVMAALQHADLAQRERQRPAGSSGDQRASAAKTS